MTQPTHLRDTAGGDVRAGADEGLQQSYWTRTRGFEWLNRRTVKLDPAVNSHTNAIPHARVIFSARCRSNLQRGLLGFRREVPHT